MVEEWWLGRFLSSKSCPVVNYNIRRLLGELRDESRQEIEESNNSLSARSYDILNRDYERNYKTFRTDHQGKSIVDEPENDTHNQLRGKNYFRPIFSSERQLLCEVIATDRQVRIVTEIPGISDENIAIDVYHTKLVIMARNKKTEYYEVINLPDNTDTDLWKTTYSNGFLEIVFNTTKANK